MSIIAIVSTYSMSVKTLWQSSQTRTWNSWPRAGRTLRLALQLSQIAFPQLRQWCCLNPMTFCSYIALTFQKKGREHRWQVSLSAHAGVCSCLDIVWIINWMNGRWVTHLFSPGIHDPGNEDTVFASWDQLLCRWNKKERCNLATETRNSSLRLIRLIISFFSCSLNTFEWWK